jgi:hypothetical protein
MKYMVSHRCRVASLRNGRALIPGELISLDPGEVAENRDLINSGDLMRVREQQLTKTELMERARAHDISGRSSMSEDDLRAAVADAENPDNQKEGDD